MVNALGVLGWGVGGIEAEAAMLGQPVAMVIPEVIGFGFKGKLREGVTATDLVLTCTQMLRKRGVVEKFVEYYGDGLDNLSVEDRATIANMAPEYGATCGFFPVDGDTLKYLKATGRDPHRVALAEAYCKAQGLWREPGAQPVFTDALELDLATVEPSMAGPKRPQDRVALINIKPDFAKALPDIVKGANTSQRVKVEGTDYDIGHGDVVIAAITSCTNTSNPSVLVAAGLVARNARAKGPASPSRGSRPRWRPDRRSSPTIWPRPTCRTISTRSVSIWRATAAPPASAIPARCRTTSPMPSARPIWSLRPCCRAIAISKAASTPT